MNMALTLPSSVKVKVADVIRSLQRLSAWMYEDSVPRELYASDYNYRLRRTILYRIWQNAVVFSQRCVVDNVTQDYTETKTV